MTDKELYIILREGEGYNVEFKKSMPSKLREAAEEICAFANAAGGILLIGVNDNNTIEGVSTNNSIRSKLQEAVNCIEPKLDVKISEHELEGKKIIALECESGKLKPYILSGNIYVRSGPNTQKITSAEQMREFFQASDRIFFDEGVCKEFNYPKDFDSAFFKKFLSMMGITDGLPEKTMLENLRLLSGKEGMKKGAVLLFAKDPQWFYEQAVTRCLLFKGIDKRYILDSKVINGNLIHQYEEGIKYIISKLNLRYEIESQGAKPRKEILEIPEVVFKEALINALAHRDYYEKGAITHIEIFDNRVDITNPGGLVNSIPKEEFGERSFSRNPLIFGLFERADLVERVGSGIKRMRDEMQQAGLPAPVFSLEGIFAASFSRPIPFEKWLESWSDTLTGTQQEIIKVIYRNNKITKPELSELIGISKTGIDNNIDALKALNILHREGSRKTGSWVIKWVIKNNSKYYL